MYGKYQLTYAFPHEGWDASAQTHALAYWQARRFRCTSTPAQGIAGKRGTLWGNLTAYDMTRVLCALEVVPTDTGFLHSTLEVNSFAQDMTEWNLTEFKLELLLFRRKLRGLPEPEFLQNFRSESNKAALTWTLTLMAGGRTLTPEWRALLDELTEGTEEPLLQRAS